jgi:hypothetical protein
MFQNKLQATIEIIFLMKILLAIHFQVTTFKLFLLFHYNVFVLDVGLTSRLQLVLEYVKNDGDGGRDDDRGGDDDDDDDREPTRWQ